MTVYGKAKRAKKNKSGKKKVVVTCIILLLIILAIGYIIYCIRPWEFKNDQNQTDSEVIEPEQNDTPVEETPTVEEPQDEIVDTSDIPATMGNYKVVGQLVIDKIDLKKNILAVSEDASLNLSVAHFYPPGLGVNESGNFCIDGHNYNGLLKRLSEMQVGDTFYMINRETKTKVNYAIYDKYTCVPEDLSCLDQNHDGKREVTLITCNPGGLTRLICKARET